MSKVEELTREKWVFGRVPGVGDLAERGDRQRGGSARHLRDVVDRLHGNVVQDGERHQHCH